MTEEKMEMYVKLCETENEIGGGILSVGYQTYFGCKLALKPFLSHEIFN